MSGNVTDLQDIVYPYRPAPTDQPCPSWCINPTGHGYDCEGDDGRVTRYHSSAKRHVPFRGVPTSLGQMGAGHVRVDLCAEDSLVAGKTADVSAAAICLYVETVTGDPWLSADEAIELADCLVLAAEQLRRVEGGAA